MMGWKQIYPEDCYRKMLVISGETGVSFPKVVNILIREGLIRLGEIPEETSLAHMLKPKDFIPNDPHLEAVEKRLTNILRNWNYVKGNPKSRDYWIREARKYKQLPAAQEILELAEDSDDRRS